jgi:hypothetical protein
VIFCCTKKLQKLLSLKTKDFSQPPAQEIPDMAEWYCNLMHFERRKCLMFTHARSLYTVLLFDVKKAALADFGAVFRARLTDVLQIDGFSPEDREHLLLDSPDSFANATRRGVIGSMVDHAKMCRYSIGRHGGFDRLDITKLNRSLNATPMGLVGMEYAVDALKECVRPEAPERTQRTKAAPRKNDPRAPKGKAKAPAARKRCGLCGKTGKLRKTECCGNWICDDEDKYVPFSYARNSCDRNHRRQTLCGFHYNEEHTGDWKTCAACRESFETEMYVWYGTNEYNFEKLPNPPSYAPTKCAECGTVIHLGTEDFMERGSDYLCEKCSEKEMAKLFDKPAAPGSPRASRPRGKPQVGGRRRK